jgi:predicted amidohydrolase YtcJ
MSSCLFYNGVVWLGNGLFTESFGVTDGIFSFTGNNSQANSIRHNYDTTVDLNGKLVLPAFTDGHVHLVKGSLARKFLDCSGVKSAAELRELVKNFSPDKKWILGANLNISLISQNNDNVAPLIGDDIYTEKPFFITNYDHHSAICNTKALAETGLIYKSSEFSPEEIEIYNGKPTGIIREKALYYLTEKIPEPDLKTRTDAVREFIGILHSYGITSVSDITLPGDLDVYAELFSSGYLKIRINSYLPFREFKNIGKYKEKVSHIPGDLLSIKGFKAFWDGALGSETALYSMNYKGKNYNGYRTEIVNSGEIFSLAREIDWAGYQIAVHAIGDLAVKETLDMLTALPDSARLRHRIEHSQHIKESDITRFHDYGVIASVQPVHLKYDRRAADEKLDSDLIKLMHNYREIIRRGGIVSFGTDFPIADINPFENIYYAVSRGNSEQEDNSLCFGTEEAVNCYTYANSYATHKENIIGAIRKGCEADFIILEDNIFEQDAGSLINNKVLKSYFKGEEVFSADL